LIRVIDLGTGEVVATSTLEYTPFATEFSPDGTRLAVGSIDTPVAAVIDTRTGEEVFRLQGHTWQVNQATWSPDGAWIATVSSDGSARLWDARNGAPRFTLEGHSAPVNAADWSPDSRRLVTGSQDGTARVWKITEQGAVEQLALSSVDTRNGIFGVAFSPDGGRVMAGVFATTATVVWDVTIDGSAESAALPALEDLLGVAEFSPDGEHLMATGPDRTVTVWETEDWRETVRIGPASGAVMTLAVSADSRWLATGSFEGPVDVWELTTGEHRSTIPVPFADDVAWSPDGDLLAIANDATLSVFDGSGEERAVLRGEPGVFFTSVRFDATGSQLVSTQSWTGRPDFSLLGVRVWDWARGEQVRTIETPAETAVFAPDGESILASNIERGRAELFDAASGERVATLSGHTGVVMDTEFSPDGSLIATSGSDATVRIWDGSSGAPRVVLRGHELAVGSVTFSPDSSKVASVGADGIVRVWALDRDDLVAIAEREITRTLTDAECRRYLHVEECSGG
jgi:WD40 repeat protein